MAGRRKPSKAAFPEAKGASGTRHHTSAAEKKKTLSDNVAKDEENSPEDKCAQGSSRDPSPEDKCAHGSSRDPSPEDKCAHGSSRDPSPEDKCAHGSSRDPSPEDKCARGSSRDPSPEDKCARGSSRDSSPEDKCAGGSSRDPSPDIDHSLTPAAPPGPCSDTRVEAEAPAEKTGEKNKGGKSVEKHKSPLNATHRKRLSDEDSKAQNVDSSAILHKTLDKLKIRMSEKSRACEAINKIEKVILKHLRTKTICFKQVEEPLHTGSYYENLKISNPDEFDIMFPIPVERVELQSISMDGAFYAASLKRGYNPLLKFQREGKHLPASDILQEFRSEVLESIRSLPGVKHDDKKRGCPAVTLSIEVDESVVSLDIVLCLVVQSSWPTFTKDGLKIESWLGRKSKRDYKYKPYYLVAKYEGKGTVEKNGICVKDCWRISFSHIEKEIMQNHGSEKTCCEKDGARCCRKDCLKLLKHLLSLLKEQDKSFDKFCSYHVKTTFLHACSIRNKDSQWAAEDLTRCFVQLIKQFENHLEHGQLNNFFIPTQNLLTGCSKKSCKSLALCIKKEREEGFPIFKC